MKKIRSVVVSMRLPAESENRLKRMATRHGWTPSDASARLVEEGLRRLEFAFIDSRDSAAGRQAYIQASTLAVWEVLLLVRSYRADVSATARQLKWPEAKVQAAINYAKAAPYTLATRTYFSRKPVRTFTYFRKSACYRGEWGFEGFSKKTR